MKTLVPALAAMIGALTMCGCNPRITQIEMDPLEFTAFSTPEGMRVQAVDPGLLFKDGTEAFKKENFHLASKYFALVVRKFPDSAYTAPALYNFGLARLRFGLPADAVTAFKRFLKEWPQEDNQAQVRRYLIQALLESGNWDEAAGMTKKELSEKELSLPVRFEMMATLARALRKQGHLGRARKIIEDTLRLYDANVVDPDIKGNYHAAMAAFEDGEVWRDLFTGIRFVLPKERMEKDLSDKGAIFQKARSGYLRTVRMGNIYWSSLAGVRMGKLFEEFYYDIMNGEIPPRLSGRDRDAYIAELRSQARPMLEKAVELYERNMKTSYSYGAREEWFTDMKTRLRRLKKLLNEKPKTSR